MRKFTLFFVFLLFVGMQAALAQTAVKGTVTDAKDGTPLPGVSIVVKGTLTGTVTDINGNYTLTVPAGYNDLIFSFVGMLTKEAKIDGRAIIDVTLEDDIVGLDEVVVTALGISRERKSLGYATQEVSGDEINQVKTNNFVSTLSGKVAGVQVKTSGNIGGSTNFLIRGSSSITGNNQALIVVDGVPINNDNVNTTDQLRGRSGFDYGNAGSDINPNDIESLNVLKGAAATALYGSRAANGAIIITTKKGTQTYTKKKVYGVNISSNVTTGFVDKSTFPKYQENYGGGYGTYYYGDPPYGGFEYLYDINGDGELDYSVPTYEDASYGQKFDPSFLVYQWDSFDPDNPNYQKATPWKMAENGPITFFETPWSYTNSVDVTGGGESSAFRLSYTNQDQSGIMPNSNLKKNNVLFNGSYDVLKNLKITASANYINTMGKGRNSTGYSDNIMSSFRQWMETNVDYKQQKDIYNSTHRNVTWNPNSPEDLAPAYWDNPYFQRYENYETDQRDRIIGFLQADWKINAYFSLMGRYAIDTYSELQEERKAVGSAAGEFGVGTTAGRNDVTSGYSRFTRSFMESNLDLMLKFHKDLSENLNLSALLGTNIRRSRVDQLFASTNNGLEVPYLYTLGNSKDPMLPPEELLNEIGVNGVYAQVSLGYKDYLYLDATIRRDQSSTLPEDNNAYYYPSVSGSFIFSNLLPEVKWMNFGKLRLGFAQVGNDAPWGSLIDTYVQNPSFSGNTLYSVANTKNNPDLKPERTNSLEGGFEMYFLKRRLGFDLALYKTNTVDQIIPASVSFATGYSAKFVNAGEVENKGIELMLLGKPIVNENFKWDITLNWARNVNQVVSLQEGVENVQLAALQGGVTINARVGEPYGTIQGTDYVYLDGQKVVGSNGYYKISPTSDIILGDINPDWNAGLNNRFTYKDWALSFLIDWQQGGSIFSLDMYYGMATGLYAETDFINDLGNPVRNSNEDGGGIILEGVKEDGTPNDYRTRADNFRVFGYDKNPNAAFIYDATYIKLREVILTYSLPDKILKTSFINAVSFSLTGYNLWFLYKDLPHADPEASQSSGNVQGWQSGVMPATRNIGLTVTLQF